MTQAEWFFLACAIIGGVVFLVRMVLMFVGMGGDGDLDSFAGPDSPETDHASDESFRFLSIQSMSSFFLMFGLVGLTILRSGGAVWLAFAGAIGSGGITVWLVSLLFKGMRRLQSDGTLRINNAIGQEGTVYLTIPANGSGQVQVAVQGAMRIFEARSARNVEIHTGERVRVVEIAAGSTLMVEQVNQEPARE